MWRARKCALSDSSLLTALLHTYRVLNQPSHQLKHNTAAKRLGMRQVDHFRSLFQSVCSDQRGQSLPRALGLILYAACGSVVLLHATSVFDYIVVIEIAFMDNQGEITETTRFRKGKFIFWFYSFVYFFMALP